ncbi:MAG: HDOD domain-containing protein [Betaproteobacteria bacterium]|nr:HDOD domain-containing protein [Betaproteobacteria bacterium]
MSVADSGRDSVLEAVLASGVSLPSPSQSLLHLREAAADPRMGPRQLADIVEQDPVLVGALVRVANSPVFYQQRAPRSLAEVIALLGATKLLGIAVSSALRGKIPGVDPAIVDAIWARSADVAACTFQAARRSHRRDLADPGYFTALVHDAGLCVMLRRFPLHAPMLRVAHPAEFDAAALAFDAAAGTEHAAVGALIVRNWKLPAQISDAVNLHHTLPQLSHVSDEVAALTTLVALGRRLADGPSATWETWAPLAERWLGVDAALLASLEIPASAAD